MQRAYNRLRCLVLLGILSRWHASVSDELGIHFPETASGALECGASCRLSRAGQRAARVAVEKEILGNADRCALAVVEV